MNGIDPPHSVGEEKARLQVIEFSSYEDVTGFWRELNHSYKDGDLTLDLKAHQLIWDHFYKPRGARLKILVGLEGGACIGIFPFIWNDRDPFDPPHWSLSDEFIIAREYFCPPESIHRFIDYLPPHYSDDLSCFYVPQESRFFQRYGGGVVDLKSSPDEYLQSLTKKHRHTLKRTLHINEDITVVPDTRIRWDSIQAVLQQQLDHWMKKTLTNSEEYYHYSRDKVSTDLVLMARAEEMERLVALYFYLKDELVAANFSVRRESNRVDDYVCLRSSREDLAWRGLGIFAILKNMDHARNQGLRFYDLSACLKDYKRKFINTESSYYYLGYEGISAAQGEAAGPAAEDPSPPTSPQTLNGRV